MIKELLGIPIFDISKRLYLGQYISHIVNYNNGNIIWQIDLGVYNLFCESENKKIYPLVVNGLPTLYFNLLLNGLIKPKMFYEQKQKFNTIGVSENCIINLDYVCSGRDNILLLDLQNVIEDIEFIRKLDSYAGLKEIVQQHAEKIKTLKLVAQDYKKLYEIEKQEKELIETQLERYRTFYENIRLTIIEMETELDKLHTIIERLSRQLELEKEEKEKLENIIYSLRRYLTTIKDVENKVNKESDGK